MHDNITGNSDSVTYFDYLAFKILWTLTGDEDNVKQTNKNSIDLISRTLNIKGFAKFLNFNYLEYYGLYTEGGEYKLSNGKIYTGLYHIHPDKGAMVGRVHVETPHDKLIPIDQPLQVSASVAESPPPTPTPRPQQSSMPSGGGYSSGY